MTRMMQARTTATKLPPALFNGSLNMKFHHKGMRVKVEHRACRGSEEESYSDENSLYSEEEGSLNYTSEEELFKQKNSLSTPPICLGCLGQAPENKGRNPDDLCFICGHSLRKMSGGWKCCSSHNGNMKGESENLWLASGANHSGLR
eukprot:CAMPEP_0185774814 /NCGR_PEP_ID=MMETSP1174-20130828/79946_1 /TAXON_ID=35687 /ORGANISM="Dictyocha speculum, Strain CCMP1381" /LENGTH=146 /DNA_ID=CAMNT_0028462173 /DNA_START=306 /DNA_END=743 /DNA_ORIENTATION=+